MTDFQAPPIPPKSYTAESEKVSDGPMPSAEAAPVESVTPVAEAAPALGVASVNPAPERAPVQSAFEQKREAAADVLQQNMDKLQEKTAVLQDQFKSLPTQKKNMIIGAALFVLGMVCGALFFGGSDDSAAPVAKGLQGVVSNTSIKEPLKRCGQVSPSSACVLYVMNSYDYDKMAQDFYDTAVAFTSRKISSIKMDNMLYGSVRIPPGHFAQIKIPALR